MFIYSHKVSSRSGQPQDRSPHAATLIQGTSMLWTHHLNLSPSQSPLQRKTRENCSWVLHCASKEVTDNSLHLFHSPELVRSCLPTRVVLPPGWCYHQGATTRSYHLPGWYRRRATFSVHGSRREPDIRKTSKWFIHYGCMF